MKTMVSRLFAASALLLPLQALQAEDLMTVYRIAQQTDPQMAAASAAYSAAMEAKPQSRAGLLPTVTASANWDSVQQDIKAPTEVDNDYETNSWSLTVTQPLFRWDNWLKLSQSDATIAQSEALYNLAQQELVLRVANAYFDVLAAKDSLDFAIAEKKAIGQQLRQTKQRFEVGLSAITDVHEARAGYDAAVAQEINARNTLDIARESLREITNRDFSYLAALSDDMPLERPNPTHIDTWEGRALKQNLELLAADAALQVIAKEMDIAKAGHYPTLDLIGQYRAYDNTDAGYSSSLESSDTTVRLELSIPIYSGGLTSSRVRQASQEMNQAREELEQQRRATIRETRSAYLNVVTGISQVEAQKQALSSAETALEATQAGFEVGTRTAVDVLDAQRVLFGAKRDYSRSRYDYMLSTLSLKLAAGTLGPEDIRHVNQWLK